MTLQQAAGYQYLKLRVVDFVDRFEEVMISVLKSYGLAAQRSLVNRGVWVKAAKLGFVGIALRRRIGFTGSPSMSLRNSPTTT